MLARLTDALVLYVGRFNSFVRRNVFRRPPDIRQEWAAQVLVTIDFHVPMSFKFACMAACSCRSSKCTRVSYPPLKEDYCDLESTGNTAYIGYKSEKKSQNF